MREGDQCAPVPGYAACRVCHTSTCHVVLNQLLYRLYTGRSVNHSLDDSWHVCENINQQQEEYACAGGLVQVEPGIGMLLEE